MKKPYKFLKLFLFATLFSSNAVLSVAQVGNTSLTPVADAFVNNRPDVVSTNFGTDPELAIAAWTWSGTEGICRSFLQFDLTLIPSNATITSATLNLYVDMTDLIAGGQQYGDSSRICFVTSSWTETGVTWNNQPTIDTIGAVNIPMATSTTENYSLDVTSMVKIMYANPSAYYGFGIKLDDETPYADLIFCSKENSNNTPPKLNISYTTGTTAVTNAVATSQFSLYPNPANSTVNYTVAGSGEVTASLSDLSGKVISVQNGASGSFDVSALTKGMYIVSYTVNGQYSSSQKLIVSGN